MLQGCLMSLALFFVTTTAGPLQSNGVRIRRDETLAETNNTQELNGCVLEDIEYQRGDAVPSLSPCEVCRCEAPDVLCSMIKCPPNSNGCKVLQQSGSGQCCPEYKCGCEYNGRPYDNGERLEKPEDPCQVCYCKGGEIMCTSITCYERDDCEPRYVTAQCCPKYDHCPVETSKVSSNSVRSVNGSGNSPKREMQPWPLTKPSSDGPSSQSYDETSGVSQGNLYPQTIKILEILPTTPGYVVKPSEVSVIPKVKTVEREEYTNEADARTPEEAGTSTTDLSSTNLELQHLMETTTEIAEVSPSTLNPLSELVSSTEPSALPDSMKMAKIIPNYSSTESDVSPEEGTTPEVTTIAEGTGYELIKGGLYEEYLTEPTESSSAENSTDIFEELKSTTVSPVSNETEEVEGSQNHETFTSTETPSLSARMSEGNSLNETSGEITDVEDFNNETKGELKSESSSSEESEEEDLGQTNTTTESSESESWNSTTTEEENNASTYTEDFRVESTTYNEFSISTENDETPSTTASPTAYSVTSQNQLSTGFETTTDKEITAPLQEKRKIPRQAIYRELETEKSTSESNSSLNFPSVLKVQSLGINTQTESSIPENTTTMARVGIYHPAKTNELAGYLTLVDEKRNTSSSNNTLLTSQLLLTPQDLKKLAEILIKEKIKPADEQVIRSSAEKAVNEERSFPNDDEGKFDSNEDIQGTLEADSTSEEDFSYSHTNDGNKQYLTPTEKTILDSKAGPVNVGIENPRGFQIADSSSHQYSALLDERDLRLLENFFRMNMGLH